MIDNEHAGPARRLRLLGSVAATLMLGGCVGDEYNYDWETPVFAASSDETVVVVVQDQRPYVLVGDKRPSFVGLQRIAFGIPYNVSTASGRPLADDMVDTIVRGLAVNDVAVEAVYVPASADASMRSAPSAALADSSAASAAVASAVVSRAGRCISSSPRRRGCARRASGSARRCRRRRSPA